MENLSLVSSPKMVLGISPSLKNSIFSKPLLGFPRNLSPNKPSAFHLPCFYPQGPKRGKIVVLAKIKGDQFANITSSNGQQTSSVGVNPIPVQPPSSPMGSPLFWIGVGVALSALFSWKYAMQQAFKMMMGQMNKQSNQFGNSAFSSKPPFPYAPSPASITSTSPSPVASQPVTVDVSATNVEEPPATDIKDDPEPKKPSKKYAFVDVSPEETFQKSAFESYKESVEAESSKDPSFVNSLSSNGAAPTTEGPSPAFSSTGKTQPILSVEDLEKMMEDPAVQQMLYPYLPEEMRNPATFKWMLQNPVYRQQMQDMLNNMGGSTELDSRLVDNLKNFDLNSPEIRQQFGQIGLTPEEAVSKIMGDPDIAMAMQNPRVQAAILDISQNPMSIAKYQNDPEIVDVFKKISEIFPGLT